MKKNEENSFNRRSFLTSVAVGGWLGSVSLSKQTTFADDSEQQGESSLSHPVSYPVLQNPSPRRMTVVWGVNTGDGTPASGWVEWGKTKDLGQTTRSATFGLNQIDEHFLSATLHPLEPNSTYYYRTATCRVAFKNAYDIQSGEPVFSDVYSFKTPGNRAKTPSFAVMNDTHENQETLAALVGRINERAPDQIIWNGDLLNAYNEPEQVLRSVFCPQFGPFAAERPLLFNNGNHDHRGIWARNKSVALTPWNHARSGYADLGRNFALRSGPLALIGLDTGEDKPDANPVFAGLAQFEPYRKRQAEWLAKTLESKSIRTAPFIVALCHIPIFDSNPTANPGDIMENFADWQRPASQLWGPILKKAGVQLVIAAHTHSFRYDAPTPDRPWAQLVGGGPNLAKNATILYGRVAEGKLTVVAEKLADQTVLGKWDYEARETP